MVSKKNNSTVWSLSGNKIFSKTFNEISGTKLKETNFDNVIDIFKNILK